ncbi:MAG: hypothetical protein JWO56_11 [Acidobacteria bacterium]|nr:hypothetical protein [Acidobacteriota bacterium]
MNRPPRQPRNAEGDIVERIRSIFLNASAQMSIADAARLLAWSRLQMKQTIASGDLIVTGRAMRRSIPREELMAKALELWPLDVIEEALGPDAPRILPAPLHTAELRVRLPRYQIAMLEYRGGQHQTTVSGILTRHLDDVASAHAEELSAAIPGFGEALTWPE